MHGYKPMRSCRKLVLHAGSVCSQSQCPDVNKPSWHSFQIPESTRTWWSMQQEAQFVGVALDGKLACLVGEGLHLIGFDVTHSNAQAVSITSTRSMVPVYEGLS